MGIEYEAKFLDVDVTKMRKKLKDIGATLDHPRKRYVRSVYHRCTQEIKGYARVRDEGDKVTLTVKTYADPKFPQENEITIEQDFESAIQFMNALGLTNKAFQESYREKWKHKLAHEITFDTLPGLPTYMEIDCDTLEKLDKLIKMLDLDRSKMRFGPFDATYNEYYGIERDVLNNKTPSLTFKNISNEIVPIKNKELLMEMANEQKALGGKRPRKLSRKKRV
jgi:adenylate cyclase class 2